MVVTIPKNSSPLGRDTIKNLNLIGRKDHFGPLNTLALEFEKMFLDLLKKLINGIDISHQKNDRIIQDIKIYMKSNTSYCGFSRSFFRKRLEEFDRSEKTGIEKALRKTINLNITIPEGVEV